jgi:histone H3/H4
MKISDRISFVSTASCAFSFVSVVSSLLSISTCWRSKELIMVGSPNSTGHYLVVNPQKFDDDDDDDEEVAEESSVAEQEHQGEEEAAESVAEDEEEDSKSSATPGGEDASAPMNEEKDDDDYDDGDEEEEDIAGKGGGEDTSDAMIEDTRAADVDDEGTEDEVEDDVDDELTHASEDDGQNSLGSHPSKTGEDEEEDSCKKSPTSQDSSGGGKKGRKRGGGGSGTSGGGSNQKRGRAPSVAGLTIPFRTIKKAMKLDPDIPIVQNEAAIMTTLAAELFLKSLAQNSFQNAKNRGRNTIRYEDVAEARVNNPSFSFLETLLP